MELLSSDGVIDVSIQQPLEEISTGLPLFEKGDVLFAKITPCMENGKGAFVRELPTRYAFGSTEFHVLRAGNKVDGQFLYYATFNPVYRAYAAENMVGAAGQKRVSSRFLKDTRLFLPPLPEQLRIAAYLDASCTAIDAAVAAKRRQLETLDAVRESIIETAVTRGLSANPKCRVIDHDWIGALPERWEAVRIKRVTSRLDYGISVSSEPEGKYPVLKMGNIQGGEIVFSKMEFVGEVAEELLLEHNDLLYNRTNSPDQVGKAALFLGSKDDAVTFASYLVRLRVNHRIIPEFLNYVVNCAGFLAFARRLAIPSVQQSNLNSTRYGRLHIPLPSVTEQRAICEHLNTKVGEMKRVVTTIETQIAILTAYRKSLIHECVTGQRRITESDIKWVKAHG
ncbi:MAG: restriction endonuclease subunit S [Nitrospirota bacterium]|nr:restriction endonuclease subunit S [Nitrospirota bacterium]